MDVDTEEYISKFRPELMEFAADWCLGIRFQEIQQRSDFFEVYFIHLICASIYCRECRTYCTRAFL